MRKIIIPEKIEREILRIYTQENKSIREISLLFNINHNKIRKILIKYNIKMRKPGCYCKIDLDREKVKEMYIQNEMSLKEIANHFGCGISPIMRILKKEEKIVLRNFTFHKTPEIIKKISETKKRLIREGKILPPSNKINLNPNEVIELFNNNLSPYKIAERFNCDNGVIYRILRENNISLKPIGYYAIGKPGWNVGLTKETDERIYKYSKLLREKYQKDPNIKCGFKVGFKHWAEGLTKENDERIRRGAELKRGRTWEEIHGKNKTKELKERLTKRISGEKHPLFNNWSSREPYGIEFNEKLKEQIRYRDNYICQECLINQSELKRKLDTHHIDYCKKNNSELNLISLCAECHIKTNINREHWTKYFQMKMFIGELFNPQNILLFNENKQLIRMSKI